MADKKVTFTEDEMKKINDLQQGYVNLQNALGQISVNRIRLEQQFDDLDKADENIRNQFVDIHFIKFFAETISESDLWLAISI